MSRLGQSCGSRRAHHLATRLTAISATPCRRAKRTEIMAGNADDAATVEDVLEKAQDGPFSIERLTSLA